MILQSEADKIVRVNRAEAEKRAAVLAAEAEREAAFLRADGDKGALELEGQALRIVLNEVSWGLREATGEPVDMPPPARLAERTSALLLARQQVRAQAALAGSNSSKVVFLPNQVTNAAAQALSALTDSR